MALVYAAGLCGQNLEEVDKMALHGGTFGGVHRAVTRGPSGPQQKKGQSCSHAGDSTVSQEGQRTKFTSTVFLLLLTMASWKLRHCMLCCP